MAANEAWTVVLIAAVLAGSAALTAVSRAARSSTGVADQPGNASRAAATT